MNLPFKQNLPVEILAKCFKNTVATYKFYWFLAIIEEVEQGATKLPKHKLFSRMVANAWYTVNYFKLSFGKQDLIHKAVENIKQYELLTIDEGKEKLIIKIEKSLNINTINELNHFNNNVPHWFLSPWFPKLKGEFDSAQKNRIYKSSQQMENKTLYALHNDVIIINKDWVKYLQSNAKLIKDYCYWNLAIFLQARNPNVPDIPNKLIKPANRNSLSNQRNHFWKNVFEKEGYINCIFSGNKLIYSENNFALDHFVPHAFVSHDLIWNLIPIDKEYNSKKSDKLPSIENYFEKFFNLQEKAFNINKSKNPNSKYMEEYLTIFPNLNDFSYSKFKDAIQPLITIAHNNGFSYYDEKK